MKVFLRLFDNLDLDKKSNTENAIVEIKKIPRVGDFISVKLDGNYYQVIFISQSVFADGSEPPFDYEIHAVDTKTLTWPLLSGIQN